MTSDEILNLTNENSELTDESVQSTDEKTAFNS
jgi:hypothetical protein